MKKKNKKKIVCQTCGNKFWIKNKDWQKVKRCPFCGADVQAMIGLADD